MASIRLFTLFTFLFVSLLDVSASPLVERTTFAVGQVVKTTSGTVVGHAAQSRNQVSEYLGIPFAQPPVGNLRFAAPQPFNGTTNSTIIASKFVSKNRSLLFR
jgi:Carboxylesterase family